MKKAVGKKDNEKAANKGKKRVWECKFREHCYDDLTNVMLCNNAFKSGSHTCICSSVFQIQVCPFFEKGKSSCYLQMTDYDKKETKKFLDKLELERNEREIKERALLEHLKSKYER